MERNAGSHRVIAAVNPLARNGAAGLSAPGCAARWAVVCGGRGLRC